MALDNRLPKFLRVQAVPHKKTVDFRPTVCYNNHKVRARVLDATKEGKR